MGASPEDQKSGRRAPRSERGELQDGPDLRQGGSRTISMDVAPNDKVSDTMKRIPSGGDTYVTSGGRVLRGSDKLSCGVSDDSAHEQDAGRRKTQG